MLPNQAPAVTALELTMDDCERSTVTVRSSIKKLELRLTSKSQSFLWSKPAYPQTASRCSKGWNTSHSIPIARTKLSLRSLIDYTDFKKPN